VLVAPFTTGGIGCAITGEFELSVFGFSLEHPTANEHTIKSAANTSVLFCSKLIFPHATESRVDAILLTELNLKRAMFGHLLLTSSTSENARLTPEASALILQDLTRNLQPWPYLNEYDVSNATQQYATSAGLPPIVIRWKSSASAPRKVY
jgi:hypothetical protein